MKSRARLAYTAVVASLVLIGGACQAAAPATPTPRLQPTPTLVTTPGPRPTAKPGAPAEKPAAVPANPETGKQLFVAKGCVACHAVQGVPGATGTVGPALDGFASRPTIAGTLPNTPENQAKWLKNPPAIKPGTQMPNLNLTDQEVAALSAFLQTLK